MDGVAACFASAKFNLGTVRLELVSGVDGSIQGPAQESAVNMLVTNDDWSGHDTCGIAAGPVTKDAYFSLDRMVSLNLEDPDNAFWPFANMQLSFLNGQDALAKAAGVLVTADNGRTFQLQQLAPELLGKNMVVKMSLRRNTAQSDAFYWGGAVDVKF